MYTVKYQNQGFWLEHSGVVTLEEINEANGRIISHPHFDEHRFQIVNLLQADFSDIPLEAATYPGALDSSASLSNGNVRVALVTNERKTQAFCEEYIFVANSLDSSWQFKIFNELKPAARWALGA